VFDLRQELDSPATESVWDGVADDNDNNSTGTKKRLLADNEMTNLEMITLWLNMIGQRCSSGGSDDDSKNNRIVIVGTHSDSLHSDATMQASMANLKFERILESVRGNPAVELLVSHPFFLVNASISCQCVASSPSKAAAVAVAPAAATDLSAAAFAPFACPLCSLRRRIYHLLLRQPAMGRSVPKTWTSLEAVLESLGKKNICFAFSNEILDQPGIKFPPAELEAVLKYYHSLGFLLYLQSASTTVSDEFEDDEAVVVLSVGKAAKLMAKITASYFFQRCVSPMPHYCMISSRKKVVLQFTAS
jgi:hypothetical protein